MGETLKQRITRHEGQRLKPYADQLGKITIGVGRNLTDKGISPTEMEILLDNDLSDAAAEVLFAFPWSSALPPLAQEVMVEMCFQMGIRGLSEFTVTLGCLRSGNYFGASSHIRASVWAQQTPVRANELADLIKGLQPQT